MAVTAESVVIDVIARTDKLTSQLAGAASATEASLNRVRSATERAAADVEKSTNRTNGSQMILQSVIRRTTDQFAAGAPLATIFAEHISALAEAGEMAGGSMGKLGTLLQGPLGLALSAAASIGAILATTLVNGAEAAEKQTKKVRTLADAVKDLNEISGKDVQTEAQRVAISAAEVVRLSQREIATRKLTQAKLADALADYEISKRASTTGTQAGETAAFGLPQQEGNIAALQQRLADSTKALQSAEGGLRAAAGYLIRQDVAASLDKATAATKRYADQERQLLSQYRSGAIGLEQYKAKETELERARDAATKRTRDGRGAADQLAEANARLATATDEVGRAEGRVELVRARRGKLTPAAYQAELTAAEAAVNVAKQHEQQLHENTKAAQEFAAATGRLVLDLMKTNKALDSLPSLDADFKDMTRDLADDQRGRLNDMAPAIHEQFLEQQRQEEEGIRTLSGLYYDLFSRGTKGLWDDFKHMGEEALAKLAAKKTFELITNVLTSGGTGGIGAAISGLFGGPRAAGGPVAAGTTYLVGENGPELFRAGSAGHIVPNSAVPQALASRVQPLGSMRALAPAVANIRNFNITVSADNSVTPAGFAKDLSERILQQAALMDTQTFRYGQAATPGRLRQLQNLGS